MYNHAVSKLALAFAVFSGACQNSPPVMGPISEQPGPAGSPSFVAFHDAEWSEPVNLGAPINSPATEQNPSLSKDELTLYFSSSRPGGFGERDLYVARRRTRKSPWGTPVNLGATINTAGPEIAPDVSPDGHLLFFTTNRPGGHGLADVWVSRRQDPSDDLGWEAPVNLGPMVNTADVESAAFYLKRGEDGSGTLYFSRGQQIGRSDIYVVAMSRSGEVLGSPAVVQELSADGADDASPTVRRDGREIFFWSTRSGSLGQDIWTSTRRTVHEPWSTPLRLAAPINAAASDGNPALSHDGRTLLFRSDRLGGLGSSDIWMSTRRPGRGP